MLPFDGHAESVGISVVMRFAAPYIPLHAQADASVAQIAQTLRAIDAGILQMDIGLDGLSVGDLFVPSKSVVEGGDALLGA